MPLLKPLAIALLSATLAACATGPRPVNPEKSLALNLAEAGGIDGLKDQTIPAEDYGRITSSNLVMDAGWTAAITASPAPGFSSGFGLGLGLLTMLFPEPVGAKEHQFVAWMPAKMAVSPEDAQIKMRDLTAKAMEAALEELGWKHGAMGHWVNSLLWGRKDQMASLYVFPPDMGCPSEDTKEKHCALLAEIVKPQMVKYSPETIGQPSQPSYFFTADTTANSFVVAVNGDDSTINTPSLYATISKHLPDWAYIYTPPARYLRVPSTDKDPKFPLIYYKGKAEIFAVPETSKKEIIVRKETP